MANKKKIFIKRIIIIKKVTGYLIVLRKNIFLLFFLMRVLCVAEKPSAAKKIAEILSQSDYQTVSYSGAFIYNSRNINNTIATNTRSTC